MYTDGLSCKLLIEGERHKHCEVWHRPLKHNLGQKTPDECTCATSFHSHEKVELPAHTGDFQGTPGSGDGVTDGDRALWS